MTSPVIAVTAGWQVDVRLWHDNGLSQFAGITSNNRTWLQMIILA